MYATMTAHFLRRLADEIVPQNRLNELIANLVASRRCAPGATAEDFTARELEMASMLGPSDAELDAICVERIAAYKRTYDEEKKRSDALSGIHSSGGM